MSPDQTRTTRAAVQAMWPAQWDDIAWCDLCGRDVDPTAAHSPHETDCPRRTFGADVCRCDRTVCAGCCPDCEDVAATDWVLVGLLTAVLLAALVSIILQGNPQSSSESCPDQNGACVFVGDTD